MILDEIRMYFIKGFSIGLTHESGVVVEEEGVTYIILELGLLGFIFRII